jgi:hypothetical protein
MRMMRQCTLWGALALAGLAPAVSAQNLPHQVLALYPQRTGELIFVDLRALRASPHYSKLKSQVLPERFRTLEQWVEVLGIEFDREVQQMSWAFIPAAQGEAISFAGVAEGTFSLAEVEQKARGLKLAISRAGGALRVTLGKNDEGSEFVFAFLDGSTAVFGTREATEEIVARRTQGGGGSLLDNPALRDQIAPVNGKHPLWFVLDRRFSGLAFKQMLPEASQVQGFDAVAARVLSTTLRFDLRNGLQSLAAVRCQDASDAMLLSSAAQAAVAFQALRVKDTSPELGQALSQARVNRQDTRIEIDFALAEAQFAALLKKNGFALKF